MIESILIKIDHDDIHFSENHQFQIVLVRKNPQKNRPR